MIDYFAKLILQVLAVIDPFSVSLIIGSVTILLIMEITRAAHQETDKASKVAQNVLRTGILIQLVYRAIDIVATSSLVRNGDVSLAELSPVYLLTALLALASVVVYVLHRKRKVTTQMFIFVQGALWYTLFALTQIAAQSIVLSEMNGGALTLLTLIIVILLLLVIDSTKRYYHKKTK